MTSPIDSVGAASSSVIVPVAATPPTDSGTDSLVSSSESWTVGTETVNAVTPAGTVIVPSALRTTPLLKTGEPKSPGAAVPPPSVKGKLTGAAEALLSVTV